MYFVVAMLHLTARLSPRECWSEAEVGSAIPGGTRFADHPSHEAGITRHDYADMIGAQKAFRYSPGDCRLVLAGMEAGDWEMGKAVEAPGAVVAAVAAAVDGAAVV